MNVYEKLLQVQQRLKAPKSQYNNFGNYSYRNCEDIQESVKPLLNDVKAVLTISDELVNISDRFYVKATASFIDCESTEKIDNVAYAREEESKKGMDASQITGSTSSYARKYALNGLFCIDDTKDSDKNNDKSILIDRFKEELKRTGCGVDYFLKYAKVNKIEDIPSGVLNVALEELAKKKTVNSK